jgi:hypothetical protein
MEAHTHVPPMANWQRTSHLMQRQRVLTNLPRAVLASAPHRTAVKFVGFAPFSLTSVPARRRQGDYVAAVGRVPKLCKSSSQEAA